MTEIGAIRVRQWLPGWDEIRTDPMKFQSAPPREFYLASIRASDLRALSDVHQRDAQVGVARSEDPNVQRTLQEDRTEEIRRYIDVGYPLSSVGGRRMSDDERASLRKPGWLPTAIIANIVPSGDSRAGVVLAPGDAVSITHSEGEAVSIRLPDSWKASGWRPEGASPLEIIDGQHRLSAFDQREDEDFELPVVLYDGLDFSWQAYIFWTVNIKPKRINASLAYDLYPLLREQDWLEAGEHLNVYREARAQELVEALWAEPTSLWYDRINMLGQSGVKSIRPVTQAAFVRSITASFVRPFQGYKGLGGLFGGAADNTGLKWPRGQQAAFLVYAWNALGASISVGDSLEWANALRSAENGGAALLKPAEARQDAAIVGDRSLLASDQGVRAFNMVVNDIAYLGARELELANWRVEGGLEDAPDDLMRRALLELEENKVGEFLRDLGAELAQYDWRNVRAEGLSDEQRRLKQGLRGSGGYNVLRNDLLQTLSSGSSAAIAKLADSVRAALDA